MISKLMGSVFIVGALVSTSPALADGSNELVAAANRGDTQYVERFLSGGADPNSTMANGVTALMLASELGHAEVVEILLKAGADPNATAMNGATAWMLAEDNGHGEIARILLDWDKGSATATEPE